MADNGNNMAANFGIFDQEGNNDQQRAGRRQRTPGVVSRIRNTPQEEQRSLQMTQRQLNFMDGADEEQDGNANELHDAAFMANPPNNAQQPATRPKNLGGTVQQPAAPPELEDFPDQAMILERLTSIRQHKRQVLDMINKLKQESSDGEMDKDMLRKLVDAYDNFKAQEEEYLSILQKILALKSQYATSLEEDSAFSPVEPNNAQHAPPVAMQARRPAENKAPAQRQQAAASYDAVCDSGFSSAGNAGGDAELQALIEQRDMLRQMLRQQEELRALQGRRKAQQGQTVGDVQNAQNSDYDSAYEQANAQREMLAAKRRELEDMKKKLDCARSLYEEDPEENTQTRDVIPVVAAPRRQQHHHQSEDKLHVLRGKKQRMDEIINELNALQLSASEETVDRQRIPTAMASFGGGNQDLATFNQTGARPKQPVFPQGKGVPRPEQQRNFGPAVPGNTAPQEEIRRKLKELEATKSRLAQLQTLVADLEVSGGAQVGPRGIAISPQLMRLVNELEAEGEDLDGNGSEQGDMAAAVHAQMRSAYNAKLNEQRDAVERLQDEHTRLTAIKNQLLKLNPLSDPLAAERAAEMDLNTGGYSSNAGIGHPADDIGRNLQSIIREQQLLQQQLESRATPNQRLNNTRDNASTADISTVSQPRNTRAAMDLSLIQSSLAAAAHETGFEEPEIDQPLPRSRRGTDSASSTIVNNPRLASFRRNNQLDEIQKLQHRQQHQSAGGQRNQDAGRQSTPLNTSISAERLARRRRSSTTVEHQYHQLQQHIDSIRFIFQDLMKEHDEYGGQEQQQPQQHQSWQQGDPLNLQQQYRVAQNTTGNQMSSSMTATPSWDAMPMGPSAITMQQHQLTLSLLACQQQLQLQQLEMRYLQQLCQELWQSNYEGGRTRSGSVNSVSHQQQQQQGGPMASSGGALAFGTTNYAPFDGRPLSSASLYNLLAPNPYLTLPYYPPPQFGQHNFASTMAARGLTRNNNGSGTAIHTTSSRGAGILNNSGVGSSANNASSGMKSNRNAETAGVSGRMMSSSVMQDGQHRAGSLGDRMIVSDSELSIVGESSSPFKVGAPARPIPGEFASSTTNCTNKAAVPKLNLEDSYSKSNVIKNQNNKNSNMVMTQTNGVIPELPSRASSTSGAVTNSGHVSALENGYMTPEQFDVMREAIYSEVATLISQNEQRPSFLLELFRELQLLTNDYLRGRALEAIRDLLNRYLTDDVESNAEQEHGHWPSTIIKNRVPSGSEASFRIVAVTATPERDSNRQVRNPIIPVQINAHDRVETTISESSVSSTPEQQHANIVDVSANNSFDKPLGRQKRFENLEGIKDVKDIRLNNMSTTSFKASGESGEISRSQSRDLAAVASENSSAGAEASSGNKVDVSGLEQQIQTIIDDLIPFVRGNVDAECSTQLLQYIRKLVLELTLSKCVPRESVSTFFRLQLSSGLDDTLAKFRGQKLHECGAELLADVSEVVFNELAFFRLMQNIDTSFASRQQGADSESSTVDIDTRNPETSESAPLDDVVSDTNVSSSRQSSLEEELSPMSIPDAISEVSEDLSAITAVSVSKIAAKKAVDEGNESEAAESRRHNQGTTESGETSAKGSKWRKSADGDRHKSTETVLMAPLMVQVTAATDEEEITTTTNNSSSSLNTTSSSSGQSMHTAGGGGSVTSDNLEMLKTPPSGDSRETSPPDDVEEVPEQLEHEPTPPIDSNDVTFDLTYEPHPEDQVQLTLSVNRDSRRVIDAAAAQQNDEEEEEEEEDDIARVRTPTPVMARAVAYLAESTGAAPDVDVSAN